jgi:hypothetical protein
MVDLGLQPTITAASAADVGTHETTPSSPSPTVLHVDKDFELIADITGQPGERLSLD